MFHSTTKSKMMESKTALEKPRNALVQQPILHETSHEAYCLDDSSRVEFDLMIEVHSKSSNISTSQALDIFVGNRQVARRVYANKNPLTVVYKELSPRRLVSENICISIDEGKTVCTDPRNLREILSAVLFVSRSTVFDLSFIL